MPNADISLPPGPRAPAVTRAVVWNQMLFTAGNSLVSGGFLLFFAREFGATGVWIALLSMLPETAGTLGLATRWIVRCFGGRRRGVWFAFSLGARLVSLGIPLLAFPALWPDGPSPLLLIAAFLALSQGLQAIAYVAYLSWLTDLVPETNWGRLFAKRNIAQTVVLLVLPVASGYIQDAARGASPAAALLVYAATYGLGVALMLGSMLPLLRLPDVPVRPAAQSDRFWGILRDAWRNRSLRFLLIHHWWLSFANGLTQAAFFSFSAGTLGIGRGTYYLLSGTMQLAMIPVSWWTGVSAIVQTAARRSCGACLWPVAGCSSGWRPLPNAGGCSSERTCCGARLRRRTSPDGIWSSRLPRGAITQRTLRCFSRSLACWRG